MSFLKLLVSRRLWLLGIFFAGLCPGEAPSEYQVKAAFLYSFARFVDWPPQAFPSPSSAVTICVLGEDPFGSFLDDAIRGKTAGSRTLAVLRIADLPIRPDCRILFIAASERRRMPALLASVSSLGLLTVGDTAEFAAQGGIIGLRLEEERIRLVVNLTAADKAHVRISSRVLSLATILR